MSTNAFLIILFVGQMGVTLPDLLKFLLRHNIPLSEVEQLFLKSVIIESEKGSQLHYDLTAKGLETWHHLKGTRVITNPESLDDAMAKLLYYVRNCRVISLTQLVDFSSQTGIASWTGIQAQQLGLLYALNDNLFLTYTGEATLDQK